MIWLSLQKQPVCLIKQFIPLVNHHFCWCLSKYHMKSILHYNRRHTLTQAQQTFSFFYLRCHFHVCECRTSLGKILKLRWHELYHLTYSNAFNFLSCAFQTMSSVIVKFTHIMRTPCILYIILMGLMNNN
jgi:hypothetical protein